MNPRTALLFQYIVSGKHTGPTRICCARLGEVGGMFKTNGGTIKRWLSELESAGLIAVAIDGSAFEAYPVGSLLRCKALSKTRLVIARTLFDDHANCARTLCWNELNSTGTVDLQLLEKTHSKPSTLTQHRSNVVPKAEAEAEAEAEATPTELEGFAPAPQAPLDTAAKEPTAKPKRKRRPKAPPVADNPPSLEEIQRYACETGNKHRVGVTRTFAAKFALYYGDDWVLKSGEPLRDWRKAVSGWVLRDADRNPLHHGDTNIFIPESARRRRTDFGGLDD